MSRNYTLDFYKLIATFIICFHHFIGSFNIQIEQSGYLFVEFFFILSGMFLYNNFANNKNDTELAYTKKRLKKLYPHYLLSFVVLYLLTIIINLFSKNIGGYKLLFTPLSELLMLSDIGIFKGSFNYPTWYLSVLVVGGYFIYYLLKNNTNKFIKFTGPLIVLFSYTLINHETTGKFEIWNSVFMFSLPLLRGVSDIIIGCILGAVLDKKDKLFTFKLSSYGIKLIEIITYFLIFLLLIQRTNYELYTLLLFPILIFISYNKHSIANKLFNKKIFQKLGVISYPMYLNHAFVIKILELFFDKPVNPILLTPIYFILLILYSLLTIKILDKIIIYFKKSTIWE